MTRVTLKDVAAQAGVSCQTVSKVINGQGSFTEETKARIWQAVCELEYRPNVAARNLRTRASNLVGHALPEHPRHFYLPILQKFVTCAAYVAEHEGYHVLSFDIPSDNSYDTEPYDRLFDRRQVAGFIMSNADREQVYRLALEQAGIAVDPEWSARARTRSMPAVIPCRDCSRCLPRTAQPALSVSATRWPLAPFPLPRKGFVKARAGGPPVQQCRCREQPRVGPGRHQKLCE